MSTIEDRVKKVVAEQLGCDVESIKLDSSFVDDLGADSLDTVELVMALEEEFDIFFNQEEIAEIDTPAKVMNAVAAKLAESEK